MRISPTWPAKRFLYDLFCGPLFDRNGIKDTIVFSDVDGTLLNSRHEITPYTRQAIEGLHQKGVPFVIISARSPGGIYPIVEQYGLHCAVVAYSGALILDENRRVLAHRGMPKALAGELLACIEALPYDLTWCIYSFDQWLVKDRSHPRIMREESIVKAQSCAGTLRDVTAGEVHKIMCICDPAQTAQVEAAVKAAFPQLSVVKSSDILLEIMAPGITKAAAVQTLCDL